MAKYKTNEHGPWPRPTFGLRALIRGHIQVAGSAFKFIGSHLGSTILVWLVIGISLFFPAGFWFTHVHLQETIAPLKSQPGLSVYLASSDELEKHAGAIMDQLTSSPAIQSVTFISAEQALRNYQDATGLIGILDSLKENPLPASIQAAAQQGVELQTLQVIEDSVTGFPGVDDIVIENTWVERARSMSEIMGRVAAIIGVLLGVATILVTSMTVRLAIESQLVEIRVLRLAGATDFQVHRPFLYFGFYYGAGGGLVASMLMSGIITILEGPMAKLTLSYGIDLKSVELDPMLVIGLLIFGSGLGLAGALLASKRRLNDLQII
tara:strand:- start:3159 stop:4127 length:969 start_codon:yes stop_codon:yes gene_type:complete